MVSLSLLFSPQSSTLPLFPLPSSPFPPPSPLLPLPSPLSSLAQGKFVVIMSSTGTMFSQPIIPACNALEGPVYFTIDLPVHHSTPEQPNQNQDEVKKISTYIYIYSVVNCRNSLKPRPHYKPDSMCIQCEFTDPV